MSTERKGASLKNHKFLRIKDIYPKLKMHARAEIKVQGRTYDSVVQHAVNMKRCNFILFRSLVLGLILHNNIDRRSRCDIFPTVSH